MFFRLLLGPEALDVGDQMLPNKSTWNPCQTDPGALQLFSWPHVWGAQTPLPSGVWGRSTFPPCGPCG